MYVIVCVMWLFVVCYVMLSVCNCMGSVCGMRCVYVYVYSFVLYVCCIVIRSGVLNPVRSVVWCSVCMLYAMLCLSCDYWYRC